MNSKEYRAKRIALGHTQSSLAEILGVARGTITRRETGDLPITTEASLALTVVPSAKTVKAVKKGLRQSAAGKTGYLGRFNR